LVAWSWCVSRTWQLDDAIAALMGVFGMGVGIRFVALTDAPADKVSFYMYNVSHHPPSPPYKCLMRLFLGVAGCRIYVPSIL